MLKDSKRYVDVSSWVLDGGNDLQERRIRQAAHVILVTIVRIFLNYPMYLKGGLLLGLVYKSPRMSTDIDLSADFRPQKDIEKKLESTLNKTFSSVIADLGYIGSSAEVVRPIEVLPKSKINPLEKASFPGLKIRIKYISGPSGNQKEDYVGIDLSFNEVLNGSVNVILTNDGIELPTYDLAGVLAEKYRALLQQVKRKRNRRQDLFDIEYLLNSNKITKPLKEKILITLIKKCRSHEIVPEKTSLDHPEIKFRTRKNRETIKLETSTLPDFDKSFELVRLFYKNLPRRMLHNPTKQSVMIFSYFRAKN